MLLCEAAGYDIVIVETVGIGQSEVAVAGMTDLLLLVQLPNAGDDLQAIKRGVMELADVVAVNKADLDAPAAQRAALQIEAGMRRRGGAVAISAATGAGVAELWATHRSAHRRSQESPVHSRPGAARSSRPHACRATLPGSGLATGRHRRRQQGAIAQPVGGPAWPCRSAVPSAAKRENVDEDICVLGSGAHSVEIDLMQPIDPEKKPAVHTTPLNHIGLWVDDLPAAVEWLSAQGLRFAPGGIRKGAAGHDVCFIHPKSSDEFPLAGEGVLIELVQAPPSIVAALS